MHFTEATEAVPYIEQNDKGGLPFSGTSFYGRDDGGYTVFMAFQDQTGVRVRERGKSFAAQRFLQFQCAELPEEVFQRKRFFTEKRSGHALCFYENRDSVFFAVQNPPVSPRKDATLRSLCLLSSAITYEKNK